jgi:hypothetical protein
MEISEIDRNWHMPVEVQLTPDQTHLLYEMIDPVNMEQLLEAYRQEKIYRDSVSTTLHSIVDMSKMKRIPPNWLVAKAGPGLTHPRSGELLFVGVGVGVKMILSTILKIVRYDRIRFFDTRSDAEAYMSVLSNRTQPKAAQSISR